jgi:hypothetical protein
MFFDVERAGIEGPGVAKGGKVCAGESLFEEFPGREGDELGDESGNLDGWIYEAEAEVIELKMAVWARWWVSDVHRMLKNWLRPAMSTVKMRPRNHLGSVSRMNRVCCSTHIRNVFVGMVGSSVFATAARTSGYGESSSKSLGDD